MQVKLPPPVTYQHLIIAAVIFTVIALLTVLNHRTGLLLTSSAPTTLPLPLPTTTTTKMYFTRQKINDKIFKFHTPTFMSWNAAIQAMQRDTEFRSALSQAVLDFSFPEVFFECIPVSHSRLDTTQFEFVLVDATSTSLMHAARMPDFTTFREYFPSAISATLSFATFDNAGGDATLVVPSPQTKRMFGTLASFLRNSDETERQELWRNVGDAMRTRLSSSSRPTWLSTSGTGVSWLHVRLDSRPKYYTYREYANMRV